MKKQKILKTVQLSLLSAIIVILAFVPNLGYIKVPILAIQATTVHIPVIIGSILLGPVSGGILGGIFGLTSLLNNTMQPGITSFCFSPFIEIGAGLGGSPLALIVCFIPRILCGVVPYYIFKLIQNHSKNEIKTRKFSLLLAGLAGSMTNTVLVMGMIYLFFGQQYALARGIAFEAVLGVVLSVVGINGTIEALIAALISSAIATAIYRSKILDRI